MNQPIASFQPTQKPSIGELLRTLVAFPTVVSDREQAMAALDYIDQFLNERGMYIQRFEWDDHPALWATTQPNQKRPAVLLAAHLDVMPAPKALFNMEERDGKYFGRGVWDMKNAIALYMSIVDDLKGSLDNYDFGIMITTDEELGAKDGINAVNHLVHDGYLADVVVLPDGGEDWQLETSAKGFFHLTLEAHGKSAHGSRPWEGENAILKLTSAIQSIVQAFPDISPETPTFNIGAIEGGSLVNKVPDYARAELEMRVITEEQIATNSQIIRDICTKYGVKTTMRTSFLPVHNPLSNPYLRDFADCIERVTGIKNHGVMSFGGTDARYYPEFNIPVALVRSPGGGIHADNEWVDIAGLHQYKEIIRDFVELRANKTAEFTALADEREALTDVAI